MIDKGGQSNMAGCCIWVNRNQQSATGLPHIFHDSICMCIFMCICICLSSGLWAGLDPNHLPQEFWHGFSASWESSICEIKLHYPGNRTQNLLLSGEISYHTSVCWVKKTCGHSPLYPSKVGPPWLPTIRLRADTLPHPLGKPRTRGTYPLRDRHSPDGMQSRNPPGVKVEQGAGTLA